MTTKTTLLAVCSAALIGVGALLAPGPVVADGCGHCNNTRCRGIHKVGGFYSGWVNCDPCQSCACPLPQSQWNLVVSECNGQVP